MSYFCITQIDLDRNPMPQLSSLLATLQEAIKGQRSDNLTPQQRREKYASNCIHTSEMQLNLNATARCMCNC